MQQETFESKIREKLEAFERSTPSGSWERIRVELQPQVPSSTFSKKIYLSAIAAVVLLLVGFQILHSCEERRTIESIAGENLFTAYCASCHNRNMKDDLIGPALGGVTDRWKDYPREDLYTFIRSSQQMIADGHPKAIEQWNTWKPVMMTNHSDLSNQELEQLLAYVEWSYAQN